MQGTKQIVVKDKEVSGLGYELVYGICLRCGEESAQNKERFDCPKCHCKDIERFRQTERSISAKDVHHIKTRQVKYECPKCHKVYDIPTKCCFYEYDPKAAAPRLSTDNKWVRSWCCGGCGSVYFQPVKDGECCPDQKVFKGRVALKDLEPELRKEVISRNSPILLGV